MTSGRKIAFVTFGCAKNLVDSEVMAGYLAQAGYRFVETTDAADIILLNTCGFLRASKDEADAAIHAALDHKAADSGRRVIVAGCYTERHRPELEARFPGVDAWIGVQDLDHIVDVVEGRDYCHSGRTFLYSHRSPRAVSTPASWAYVKVSEGCSHRCAFCSIPLIKGVYRSRAPRSIVEEVRTLAARGVREVDLVSQDTTSYGKDAGRPDGLVRLLRKLIEVPELAWIRILYGYPEEISDGLLEILGEPKIAPYLDIPFQHSDPAIIRRMGRATSGRRALKLLDRIRKAVPGVALRTSLIVGFPGEGRPEFTGLKEFVREARFDHLGVFAYSREEGTPAYADGDPVADAVKRRRRDAILEIQSEISADILKAWKGRTTEVLIEGPWKEDPKLLIGRTRFQAPEVDGVVFVDGAGRPRKDDPALRKIEITSTGVYDLQGKPAA